MKKKINILLCFIGLLVEQSFASGYKYTRNETPFMNNSIQQIQSSIDQRYRLGTPSPNIGKRRGFVLQFTMTSFGYNWKTRGILKGQAYRNIRYETQMAYTSPFFLDNLFRVRIKLTSQYTPTYVDSKYNPTGNMIQSPHKDFMWTSKSYTWRAEVGFDMTPLLTFNFKDPNLISISIHHNHKVTPNHLLIYEIVTDVFLGKRVDAKGILIGQPWHKTVLTLEHIWQPSLTLPSWIRRFSMYTEYGMTFNGTESLIKDQEHLGKLKFDYVAFIGFNIDWKLDFQFTDNFKMSLPSFEFKFQGIGLRENNLHELVFPFSWDVDIITAVLF